ncbi:MAG: GTP binding translation elongation factor [Edafosvirus sp.]|uniref:GTP binding translation elongation factor n=1 Tax=Edafosvirus sp. TaxID=2487765 RepID=A0A3G4ZVC5_9VIRU|nr:MAG: GTP binding translation elongation factor [Edafosvirus sp.]
MVIKYIINLNIKFSQKLKLIIYAYYQYNNIQNYYIMDGVQIDNTNTEEVSKNKEVAIVVTGSVDSGKSSFIGVMTSGQLDDGNGSARLSVAKHPHEKRTGKTSDISTRSLHLDNGQVVTLIDLCGHEKYLKTTTFGITGYFPDYAIVVVAANRGLLKMTKEHLGILLYMKIPIVIVITRVDIAPAEIYDGTVKLIKKTMQACKKKVEFVNSLKEFSLSPTELKEKELQSIKKVQELADFLQTNDSLIPVISISNKTGYYVDVIKTLIKSFKPRKLWNSQTTSSIFYIDSTFAPPGIGTVVSGKLKGKSLKVGDIIYIGPQGKNFVAVKIRSMHNNVRESIRELHDSQRGCISISVIDKKNDLTRENIKKGMIAVHPEVLTKNVAYRFISRIEILNHSTTIANNYCPVINAGCISQTSRLLGYEVVDKDNVDNEKDIVDRLLKKINTPKSLLDEEEAKIEKKVDSVPNPNNTNATDKDVNPLVLDENADPIDENSKQINKKDKKDRKGLKTKDIAIAAFKFKFRPEFIEKDMTFFFREGCTRGVGQILDILPIAEDIDANPDQATRRRRGHYYRRKNKKNLPTVI